MIKPWIELLGTEISRGTLLPSKKISASQTDQTRNRSWEPNRSRSSFRRPYQNRRHICRDLPTSYRVPGVGQHLMGPFGQRDCTKSTCTLSACTTGLNLSSNSFSLWITAATCANHWENFTTRFWLWHKSECVSSFDQHHSKHDCQSSYGLAYWQGAPFTHGPKPATWRPRFHGPKYGREMNSQTLKYFYITGGSVKSEAEEWAYVRQEVPVHLGSNIQTPDHSYLIKLCPAMLAMLESGAFR